MKILSWNCRGLGQPTTVPALKELVKAHKPDVLFLFETLSFSSRITNFSSVLGFECCFVVCCVGRSGGLCVFWKVEDLCYLISYSNNHIDLVVKHSLGDWHLTGYYGFPERCRRKHSWDLLRQLSRSSSLPWLCVGDYNDLLTVADKKGRHDHPNWLFQGFRSVVSDVGLFDLPLIGHSFTWIRSRGKENEVDERLDRGMATQEWKTLFPDARILNLVASVSDHSPVLVECMLSYDL
ncbi:hypothetical protein ACS0TY_028757 [Phlomoides rotata]